MNHVGVIVLILLGAVLPILGAVFALLNVRATLRKNDADVDLSQRLREEWDAATSAASGATPEVMEAIRAEHSKRFTDAGLIVPTRESADANATGDLAVGRVLRLLARGNGWNAALVVVGVAVSTAASIWSLGINA
jgi:hypothetical protein